MYAKEIICLCMKMSCDTEVMCMCVCVICVYETGTEKRYTPPLLNITVTFSLCKYAKDFLHLYLKR